MKKENRLKILSVCYALHQKLWGEFIEAVKNKEYNTSGIDLLKTNVDNNKHKIDILYNCVGCELSRELGMGVRCERCFLKIGCLFPNSLYKRLYDIDLRHDVPQALVIMKQIRDCGWKDVPDLQVIEVEQLIDHLRFSFGLKYIGRRLFKILEEERI